MHGDDIDYNINCLWLCSYWCW